MVRHFNICYILLIFERKLKDSSNGSKSPRDKSHYLFGDNPFVLSYLG